MPCVRGKSARTLAPRFQLRNAHFRAFLPCRRRKILLARARLDVRCRRPLSPLPSGRRGCSMRIPAGDERRKNLIGGAWVPPSTDKYDPCVNPADTREILGYFPKSGAADAKAAIGAAALITPWNFPFAIPVGKTAPALVAGCTAVLKPASLTPVCAHLIAEALMEAGLPPGVLNVVTGPGGAIGDALADDPRIKAV